MTLKKVTLTTLLALSVAGCADTAPQMKTEIKAETITAPQVKAAAQALTADPAATARIKALRNRGDIQAAFADFQSMNDKNIKRLIEITEIPAPPFGEETRAADFAKRLTALGLSDVSLDGVGNVIARRKGTEGGRTVAVVAHIDTVFPIETDVTVRRDGNVFYAPGIGDNSQGMVAMMSLIEVMETHNIQTRDDILFVGSIGEEGLGDLRGVRHLFKDGSPQIDSFIAIDGGGLERLVVDAVGSNRYRVTFSGPGGHSYGAFGRAHPHQALAEAITRFTDAATPITKLPGVKATFSVGRIGGGTSINSIPFTSWMEVDMRSTDPAKLAKLDGAFQAAMAEALEVENARRTSNEALTVEVKSVGKRPAGEGDRGSTLVTNAVAALISEGYAPSLHASSTDSNIPISLGIPSLTMGRGGISRNAHAPNESWENKDPHLAYEILLLTLLTEAGAN
ncbi:M20/M25/M40 family metallo-hydrolase [Fretibacter rubidus]|uniref:M20/M25/M40 family metallo-hydrolase n=1 Tax=Fretibacter rubidus TaxID=570162 RepID=UPI00352A719C